MWNRYILVVLAAVFLIQNSQAQSSDTQIPASRSTDTGTEKKQTDADANKHQGTQSDQQSTDSRKLAEAAAQQKDSGPKNAGAAVQDKSVAGQVWDVVKPSLQLGLLLFVAGLFIWFLDLPSVLKTWEERTIVAIAIVFTFCFTVFIPGLQDSTRSGIKDVALVVIGFYFGANQGKKAG